MRRANERIWGAGGAMKIRSLTFFLTWCFLFTGCASVNTNRYLISDADGSEDYTKTLQTYLSEYEMRESTDSLYAETASGNAVACLDVQAIPAMERGVGRYWYPHVLCTVVIAVDRTQTDASITGWNSLLEIPDTVGVASTSVIRNMLVMGALSYGLNPKDPNKQKALDFLEGLSQNGRFELENMEAPVLLCMDYEAAAWNQNGGNYEIIVPMEGTLSFRMGLLSDVPLTLEHGLDQALLSAGLPLVTGERPQGFPKDYRSTRMLEEEDYDWFLKIAGNSSSDLRRQVFHTRLYTTADLKEHILSAIFVIAAILLWKGTVSNRMIRRDVQQVVSVMGWLMVGWLLLRLFKYQLAQDTVLCRMCWYGYYVFQLALPVALLYLTAILNKKEREGRLLRPLWSPFIVYVLSVLLVMTNDLHQLVFFFDPYGNWNSNYGYGFGYWIITGVSFLFFLLAIGKLIYNGRMSSHWGGKVFPIMFCAGLIAYVIAYILRVPLAWESDLTICICIFSILFLETVLQTGLIPVNTQYQKLFASAPIGLVLLDESGHTVLSSCGAPPVSQSIWKRLLMDIDHPLLRNHDIELHAVPIHGGMAVWQENLSTLNRIRQEIQDVQIRLEAANALLREEEAVKKRLLTVETKRTLFEHLDRDMERRIMSLTNLISELPEAENKRELTAYITLCLCHIKRRCNLFFLARQGESLLGDELGIYLDELIELARYAGLQMLIRCVQKEMIEIRRAALSYDFAFETISWALRTNASPLMGYLETERNCLVFRFLPGSDPGQWRFSEELMTTVSALNGQIVCKDLDDAVGICMTLPMGGENFG